jgi:hypothetical protein
MIECEGGDPDECDDATYRATSWTPYEISMVSIPADDTVGVGRSEASESNEIEITTKGQNMITRNLNLDHAGAGGAVGGAGGGSVAAPAIVKSPEDVLKGERERRNKILNLGTKHRMVDEANKAVDEGKAYEEFKEQVLDELSDRGDKKDQVSEGATGRFQPQKPGRSLHRVRPIPGTCQARPAMGQACRAHHRG